MFRAAHRSSSGALNCICSLWFICFNCNKKHGAYELWQHLRTVHTRGWKFPPCFLYYKWSI